MDASCVSLLQSGKVALLKKQGRAPYFIKMRDEMRMW